MKLLKVPSPRLENDLGAWVATMETKQIRLSRGLIKAKTKRMIDELDEDAPRLNLSDGWMTKFMRRRGLQFRQLHGKSGSVDPVAAEAGRRALQEVLILYGPNDVFNVDETGFAMQWPQHAPFVPRK
ncbi:hypothetical protein PI124_g3495 [Phytophthora idaei]|nr:hypothetical protein PI125_g2858 [Phytophthora idaei]KAG3173693.1 hypothetical protein PI126_g709 [Phytophthora idaei]KAG3251876.1 hypothetical protein PI124_g3495 [Phytophthora idaei]